MPDEEELDACDESFDLPDKNTSDEDIVALALYADIDFLNLDVVAARQAEWEALFK